MELGEGGGVWIVLFSEVTLPEYNVSTILSPTAGQVPGSIKLKSIQFYCLFDFMLSKKININCE